MSSSIKTFSLTPREPSKMIEVNVRFGNEVKTILVPKHKEIAPVFVTTNSKLTK